jgi:RNA polymerase sigma factor (sigma-70 family)
MPPDPTSWPSIDAAYTDEYGRVDAEVYQTAGQIWGQAEKLALTALRDHAAGLRLMMKAVAIVSRRRADADVHIDNLRAFLFRVYKNLVFAELKKQNRRREIEGQWDHDSAPVNQTADDLDRRILIEELVSRMDARTREVFELRMLGYKFEIIGEFLGMDANHVRSVYSKSMARLRREVGGDHHDPAKGK